ncbi:MAG: hypothetical protein LUH15_04095 [Tannerellaceae bacterium]|nr:hypothetical protein [Tannerellaceae bacterium]
MRKLIKGFVLVFLLFSSSLGAQENPNEILGGYINGKKWIEAREFLSVNQNNVDDFLYKLASSLVYHYSGKYDQSIADVTIFLEKYADALGPGKFNFFNVLLNNYVQLQEFDKALTVYEDMIEFAKVHNFPEEFFLD